ncbi:MAG TPA: hypothetical protein VHJ20_05015 [Polyangia bacterium]|nr:hypothetical protein [Polyangia bacterium]
MTGAFGEPPASSPKAQARATPAATPLAATAAPGGGMMVRLGGRFHAQMTATADAAGVHASCAAR